MTSKRLAAAVIAVVMLSLLAGAARAQRPGELLDRVVRVLERHFYDQDFLRDELPVLERAARPLAASAQSFAEERAIVHEFLSKIPTSHLAVLSADAYRGLMRDLTNRPNATFGVGMVNLDGMFFISGMLEGGPAERAGLLRGDRIVAVDGVRTEDSVRLDWRTDDAALPDPPKHRLRCEDGDEIELIIERREGVFARLTVRAANDSAFEAAQRSIEVIEYRGKRFGYVHFWYMHHTGLAPLLRDAIRTRFADCDGLLLDIRGRGGSTLAVTTVLAVVDWAHREWRRPIVALIDPGTRSAKEILAYELAEQNLATLVGGRTAGAVIPATFREIGLGAVLMFPSFSLGRYTNLLEGTGVAPHIPVSNPLPYAQGKDAILQAALDHLVRPKRRAI